MLSFLTILNVIIAGVSIVFIVRYFLIKHVRSRKTIKNILMALCLIIPLFCSFGDIFTSLTMSQSKAQLEYKLTKAKDNTINGVTEKELIQRDLDTLSKYIPEIEKYTGVALICFVISFGIHKSVVKEMKNFKPTGTWDI